MSYLKHSTSVGGRSLCLDLFGQISEALCEITKTFDKHPPGGGSGSKVELQQRRPAFDLIQEVYPLVYPPFMQDERDVNRRETGSSD
jgi:hypothetical protein